MEIPYLQLSHEALQNLITDFVSRGDDSGFEISLGDKVDQVKTQLADGSVIITFDADSGTCNIVKRR